VVLGLGKLGGREMSYHSDLDLILIYEGDGQTDGSASASNLHFFTDLAQQVIRVLSQAGPLGRLYQVDMRLRPTGGSGSLVTTLGEFERYYREESAQLWERQALTRARVVYGDAELAAGVQAAVRRAAFGPAWRAEYSAQVAGMRERVEASRGPRDLKRGPGGQADIEFLAQALQLRFGAGRPEICQPNTWKALDALLGAGLLSKADHAALRASYDFLRQVESRLRIMTNRALDEYPDSPDELDKLARRLGLPAGGALRTELDRQTNRTREIFRRLI
jgi:glutamate-ammonia-ligase adenylyltransferase